jgi:hypothetical protein
VIEEYRQSPANDDTAEVDIVEDVNEPPER